jgi:hypothetical protein
VEPLEERLAPAVFNIANGDVAGLVAAIRASDTNGQANTINLAPGGTYTLTAADNNSTYGPNGLPEITLNGSAANTLTIHGDGATIQRQGAAAPFRLFLLNGGSLALDHVTLLGGTAAVDNFKYYFGSTGGGAILAESGTLTLLDSTLSLNSTALVGTHGGTYNSDGGAINVQGGEADLTGCTLTGNAADDGGAITTAGGTVNLSGCTISGNTASFAGGGLCNFGGTVTVTGSTISGNTATDTAGSPTFGFGTHFGGGGIYNGSVLTLDRSTVTGNSATLRGGGIQNAQTFAVLNNGVVQPPATTLTVTDSTISGNTVTDAATGVGGGLDDVFALATLTDSTVANNSAGEFAGGIANDETLSQVTLISCTVTGNTAGQAVGGVLNGKGGMGTFTLHDTLIAGNTSNIGGTDDVLGAFTSDGFNLIGANPNGIGTGFVSTDLVGARPLLGPLQNNGGPTQTVALLAGSAGIDQGDPNFTGPATDQRGFNRVVDNRIDIGAFEFQPPATVTTLRASAGAVLPGRPVTLTATVAGLAPGSSTPGGSVTFLDNGVSLAVVPLSGGAAVFTAQLPPGTNSITAQYGGFTQGDAAFAPSTSAPLTVLVTVPTPVVPPTPPATTATTTAVMPVGALTPFALGFAGMGLELFEVDARGHVFEQAFNFFGPPAAPVFFSNALQVPFAAAADGALLAFLRGADGQSVPAEVFSFLNPFVEPALIAALLRL